MTRSSTPYLVSRGLHFQIGGKVLSRDLGKSNHATGYTSGNGIHTSSKHNSNANSHETNLFKGMK